MRSRPPEAPRGWPSLGLLVGSPAGGSLRSAHSLWIDLERGSGWLRQLRTQPLPAHNAARLHTSVAAARSMIVLVRGTIVLGGLWIRVERVPKTLPRRERGTVVDVESPQISGDTGWPKWAEFGGRGAEGRPRLLRRIGWSTVWMVFLASPILAILKGRFHGVAMIVAVLGLVAFAALWLRVVWAGWGNLRNAQPRGLALLGLLAVLAVGLLAAYRGNGLILLFYLTGACAVVLPPRQTVPAITAVTAVMVAVCLGFDFGTIATAFYGFQTFMIGLLVISVRRMRALIAALREAREELARLAVNEERLRFARDLHDLLGHSLSLIVLKSTLARRLLDRDPVSAGAELADIEAVGRQSLVEVRQAVSGYRDQSLAAELDRARSALSAAGIDAAVRTTGTPLPAEVDALLGWAVREGVTNVLRHSRARRCEIAVRHSAETAELEVTDDGVALASAVGESAGSGLRGLAERMASAGGRLEAGPRVNGGFRLAVRLPARMAAPAAEERKVALEA